MVCANFGSIVRNRAVFGSGLIRFQFDFGSLCIVRAEGLIKAVRFWFVFGSLLIRRLRGFSQIRRMELNRGRR
jgi:hypothetical protein